MAKVMDLFDNGREMQQIGILAADLELCTIENSR